MTAQENNSQQLERLNFAIPNLSALGRGNAAARCSLLDLLPEIRQILYQFALISRFSVVNCPFFNGAKRVFLVAKGGVRYENQLFDSGRRGISPALLRTCKKVYLEAVALLYQNGFCTYAPQAFMDFLNRIGPANTKCLHHLTLENGVHHPEEWIKLLMALSQRAPGVQMLDIRWETKYSRSMNNFIHHGLGADLQFVQALGHIQGLDMMTMSGYYAKAWPAYLQRNMSPQTMRLSPGDVKYGTNGRLGRIRMELFELWQEGNHHLVMP